MVYFITKFKLVEFDHFKQNAVLHTFVLSVGEWIDKTDAIGMFVKRGRYGGTFAHKDIASYQMEVLSSSESIIII